VRYEDRELTGVEADRDVAHERQSELDRDDELVLPEVQPLEQTSERNEQRVVEAVRAIFERRQVVVNDLALPKRELEALEALKAAVDGKDTMLARFVYADDRQKLLEQALAVLQPALAHHAAAIGDLVARVGVLRHELEQLEDSEDELLVARRAVAKTPAAEGGAADDEAPATSSLSDGPEVTREAASSTLFDGREAIREVRTSTLSDGPAVEDAAPPSTLFDGPEVPDRASAPTSLGDAADIARAGDELPEPQRPRRWWHKLGIGRP
jgi:hypothetical protein